MNYVLRAHEELIATYERLGMCDILARERVQYAKACAYHHLQKANQPIQLTLF